MKWGQGDWKYQSWKELQKEKRQGIYPPPKFGIQENKNEEKPASHPQQQWYALYGDESESVKPTK